MDASRDKIREAGATRRRLMAKRAQKSVRPTSDMSTTPLTAKELTKTIEDLLRTYYEFSYCSMRTPESVTVKLEDGTTVNVSVSFYSRDGRLNAHQ